MKLASAWMMTVLGAAAVAFAGTGRGPDATVRLHSREADASAQIREDTTDGPSAGTIERVPVASLVSFDAADAAPPAQAAPAPAFPPQPLDDELMYLRRMVTQLQQENDQLGVIDLQVAALRQQLAERDWEAQAEAADESAQHAATLEALDMLRDAEARLATGDWEGVDDELATAETALEGRTRLEVHAAREALAREDLYPAREHIALSLAQRRLQR